MTERELIAERTIYAIDKDGRGFEIRVMLGKPYQTDSKFNDWACPVGLSGLHGAFPDMHGVDSWQALTLAMNLIGNLLSYFVEDGGKLYYEKDGSETSVHELFKGPPTETPEPDGPLTDEQQERVNRLTTEELTQIDDSLMAVATTQWRKVARLVGTALGANRDSIPNVQDVFYAQRVRKLVEEERLVSEGNLDYMRFSEVKLPK
jgi:hypothetical protein